MHSQPAEQAHQNSNRGLAAVQRTCSGRVLQRVVLQDGVEGCLHLRLLLMLQPQVHALLARHQARQADLPVHAHVAIHRWVHASHAHRLRHAQVDRVPRVAALQGAGGGQGWMMCAWCRHTWLEQQQLSMAGWPSKQLAVC